MTTLKTWLKKDFDGSKSKAMSKSTFWTTREISTTCRVSSLARQGTKMARPRAKGKKDRRKTKELMKFDKPMKIYLKHSC